MKRLSPTTDHPIEIPALIEETARLQGWSPQKLTELFELWRGDADSVGELVSSPVPEFAYQNQPGAARDEDTQRALTKLGWMRHLAERHPVFVYGSLREGMGNASLMDAAKNRSVTTELAGARLMSPAHGSFPYALPGSDDDVIRGEVVFLSGVYELDVRRRLDHLEGYSGDHPSQSHYTRELRTLTLQGAPQPVWIYFAGPRYQNNDFTPVPSGDWVAHKLAR